MKIVACTHWNGIIVAGIASRLAVARQSCQSHPPSCSSVPTPTPGQWPQPEEKKIFRKRPQEKEPCSWTFTSSTHSVICICYKTILTLMPGWRSCQQMLETRFQCTSHSPCPETIVFRSTWDYFKFSGDIFSYLTQKGVLRKAHLKIIVLPSCHIRTLGKRKD